MCKLFVAITLRLWYGIQDKSTNFEVYMEQINRKAFAIDSASLLFLSTIQKNHTNSFRFSMTLTEEICPEILQKAVDNIYRGFPTIIAGFHPGFFHYTQVPASAPPRVQQDPGILHTMEKAEIHNCAYRVLYRKNTIAIEAFHALTDGFGAISSITTLAAEYLRIKAKVLIPHNSALPDPQQEPVPEETSDAYLHYQAGAPLLVPSRYSYQLPGDVPSVHGVRIFQRRLPTKALLDASRKHDVSMTVLLSTLMAEAVMELQHKHAAGKKHKPVRIMIPMDLRKMFPSHTLRNFVLYALPTLEPQDQCLPLQERLHNFKHQIQTQLERSRLASIMAYNVRTQQAWYFRFIPWALKSLCLRIGYRIFGGSNSCMTITNLGNVQLPEEMRPYVTDFEVMLTPRAKSPYNFSILSYNGTSTINISRFGESTELEERFFRKLSHILETI